MNIFAAGILKVAGDFLHAGYISACPRTLAPYCYEESRSLLELEVKEALRLEGETLVQAGGGTGADWTAPLTAQGSSLAAIGPSHAWIALLVGTCLFFLLMALAARFRPRPSATSRSLLAGVAAVTVALPVLFATQNGCLLWQKSDPIPAPWEGVARKAYLHPGDATKVLLYGLIADGLANATERVEALAEIRDEVGFPNLDLSEGQKYALTTYGMDGWGTPFRLTAERKNRRNVYHVASAGPDLRFDTRDDIVLNAASSNNDNWDGNRWAFFIRKEGAKTCVFYHRWSGSRFVYRDLEGARARTGSVLFDLAVEGAPRPEDADFHTPWKTEKPGAVYDAVAGKASYNPLVLQVVDPMRGS